MSSVLTLSIRNFRVLQSCDLVLHPGRVYALIGHSGSGKTTLLNALRWLGQDTRSGYLGLPDRESWEAPFHANSPLRVEVSWRTRWRCAQVDSQTLHMDALDADGNTLAAQVAGVALQQVLPQTPDLAQLFQTASIHTHHIGQLKEGVQEAWKALPSPDRAGIEATTRHAFPECPFEVEGSWGIAAFVAHLMIMAQAPTGSLIAFEAPEQRLHPAAIRLLMHEFRRVAEEKELILLLATHSPVLLNTYREREDEVVTPTETLSVSARHAPEWLQHFALGDLYERMMLEHPALGH